MNQLLIWEDTIRKEYKKRKLGMRFRNWRFIMKEFERRVKEDNMRKNKKIKITNNNKSVIKLTRGHYVHLLCQPKSGLN